MRVLHTLIARFQCVLEVSSVDLRNERLVKPSRSFFRSQLLFRSMPMP